MVSFESELCLCVEVVDAEYGRSVSGRNRAKVCDVVEHVGGVNEVGIETWWQISAAHIEELSAPLFFTVQRGENYFFKA